MRLKFYGSPKPAGWLGWIEDLRGAALGFVDLDGRIVWMWDLDW